MTGPDEYALYGDRGRTAPEPQTTAPAPGAETEPPGRSRCPYCGGTDFEEGFVEGTSDSLVRYYASPREEGFLGVRRFGIERRPVLARRCRGCSHLDLFAPLAD